MYFKKFARELIRNINHAFRERDKALIDYVEHVGTYHKAVLHDLRDHDLTISALAIEVNRLVKKDKTKKFRKTRHMRPKLHKKPESFYA